jgi:hypothetical protein
MKNNKKEDKLYVNVISPPNDIKAISNGPVGNASTDTFCVYEHKRHAIGSKIINNDGSHTVCSSEGDGTWQNSKE